MIFLFAEGSILFIKLKVIAKELFQWSILRQDKWQNMFLVVVNLYLQIVLERKFPFTLSSISTFSQNLVFQRLDLSYFWSHFDLVEMNIQIICQPSVNFINVKRAIFSYERCFSSFPLVTCTYKKLHKICVFNIDEIDYYSLLSPNNRFLRLNSRKLSFFSRFPSLWKLKCIRDSRFRG
jgi:hypothetical protein